MKEQFITKRFGPDALKMIETKRFGHSSWELDAIEPRRLAAIVSKAIERLVDKAEWRASGKRQQAGRDALTKVAATMKV